MSITTDINTDLRDFVVDGNDTSGNYQPIIGDLRAILLEMLVGIFEPQEVTAVAAATNTDFDIPAGQCGILIISATATAGAGNSVRRILYGCNAAGTLALGTPEVLIVNSTDPIASVSINSNNLRVTTGTGTSTTIRVSILTIPLTLA